MDAVYVLQRSAARWFLVVLPLGVFLRSAFVWIYTPTPFFWGNLIHAHSHTAYFGWAGLGLMGLILQVLPGLAGKSLAGSGALRWLLRLAPWAVGGALLTFAFQGYAPASIAFSSLNEVLWFLFAYAFWRTVRGRPVREWPASLWLIGVAVALLLVSTLGTFLVVLGRVILQTQDPVLGNSGIYLFLQAYGDGWLEVGLMGVVSAMVGGLTNRTLARWQAIALLVFTAPATLSLLVPFGLGGPLVWVGAVSGVGLGVAQIAFLFSMIGAWRRVPSAARGWWGLAAAALLLKGLLSVLPFLPGWADLARERNLLIAFLHLKLLLVVTAAQIGAMTTTRKIGRGYLLFTGGALVMVGILAAHGFWAEGRPQLGHQLYAVAFWAAVVAALGAAIVVWPVVVDWAVKAEGGSRARLEASSAQ